MLVFSSPSIENLLKLVLSYYSRDVGRVASKGIHAVENIAKSPIISKGLKVAESIAENPLVQAGLTVIPGGAAVVAAESVFSSMCGTNLLIPNLFGLIEKSLEQ